MQAFPPADLFAAPASAFGGSDAGRKLKDGLESPIGAMDFRFLAGCTEFRLRADGLDSALGRVGLYSALWRMGCNGRQG